MEHAVSGSIDGSVLHEAAAMGLKRLLWLSGWLLLSAPLCWADGPTLVVETWPGATNECKLCVPIQFGKLDMNVPLSEIGKILVIGSDANALHILSASGGPKESVLFLTVPPRRFLKHYESIGLLKNLGIKTNEQLLDAMGVATGTDKKLETLRKIEEVNTANRYIKTSKGSVHVYWIQSPLPGGSQKVYFVIDGEDDMYMLAGNVTREFFEAVLTNLKISDVP
jgi:hypothetical protein